MQTAHLWILTSSNTTTIKYFLKNWSHETFSDKKILDPLKKRSKDLLSFDWRNKIFGVIQDRSFQLQGRKIKESILYRSTLLPKNSNTISNEKITKMDCLGKLFTQIIRTKATEQANEVIMCYCMLMYKQQSFHFIFLSFVI